MAEKKFGAQVNYGWGLSLNMTGKAPAVAKRIFDTYADALAYANDVNDSAIEGLVLSVVADTDATKNGAYFIQQAASKAVEADEEKGIEAVDAKEAILVKLGSADAAASDTADALKEAKEYTDTEVKKLADSTVKTNTDAIAVLNGNAETEGSVAKAVATEKARAEGKEGELAQAISAETAARKEAIADLDAEVTSSGGTHVTVKVTEVDGVITAVNVTESDIASATATTEAIADEKTARKEAVSGLNKVITDEVTRATQAEGVLAGRVTANEEAIAKLNGDVNIDGSVAKAVADAKEDLLGDAAEGYKTFGELEDKIIAAEAAAKAAATKIADKTSGHVTVSVEEDSTTKALTYTISESDIASASALTKEITDRENAILALNATVGTQTVAEGKHVAVEVVETAGKLTSLVVVEDDIASAKVLAKVKGDVDNFFKDASFTESAKDTLKELQEYITSDGEAASKMQTAIADNKAAIEAEVARAKSAESGLTDAIAVLNGNAETEGSFAKAVATEKARAEAKELELNNAITALTQTVADNKATAEQAVATEKARAEGKEGELAQAISAETSARTADITALTQTVDNNKTAAEKAVADEKTAREKALAKEVEERDAAILVETNRAISAETVNANAITAETETARAAEAYLQSQIGTEFSSGSTVAQAIAAETSAREDADSKLSSRLDAIEAVEVTGNDAIVVSASGATVSKKVSLNLATQPSETEAGVVLSQDANGLKATLQWGTF